MGLPSLPRTKEIGTRQSNYQDPPMSYPRTPEHRARQAQAIRTWRPWEKSTGPKSVEGKARVAGNAFRHGGRSNRAIAQMREVRALLSECSERLAALSKYPTP